jgi:Protein of unknown function (DUF2948)
MSEPNSPPDRRPSFETPPGGTSPDRHSSATASSGAGAGVKIAVSQTLANQTLANHTPALKLVALDTVDLTILASHLQDAVVRVRDMAFVPKSHRFALILNRFNWTQAAIAPGAPAPTGKTTRPFERRRCALRFEDVRKARITGFSQKDKKQVLSLMTIGFEQAREGEPDGAITLLFAGGGAIRLEVECIEAELRDIGAGWRTGAKPDHPEF